MSRDRDDAATGELATRRVDYQGAPLRRADLDPDPIAQLAAWLEDARRADEPEPGAMVLATADRDGMPAARTVLLKGLEADGIAFYTNLGSQKARELTANPQAAVCFLWHGLHRQVRAAGSVGRIADAEAAAYFASRPRGSQLGAWASPQSAVMRDRQQLADRVQAAEARFHGEDVPLPPHWGGYRLRPATVEMWQGRRSRLHDRFRYRRERGAWIIERLAP